MKSEDANIIIKMKRNVNCNNKCRTFCNKITNIFTMRFLPFLN